MKVKSIKLLLMMLLPLLLLALTPIKSMICLQGMEDCGGCCPEMAEARSAVEPQIAPVDLCCLLQSSENITTIGPLQKTEDLSQQKIQAIKINFDWAISIQQNLSRVETSKLAPSFLLPSPPLILTKSSLII